MTLRMSLTRFKLKSSTRVCMQCPLLPFKLYWSKTRPNAICIRLPDEDWTSVSAVDVGPVVRTVHGAEYPDALLQLHASFLLFFSHPPARWCCVTTHTFQ
jgi:hypothetical protein